jgi:phosphoribosylglycinamide formyltransferase 2
VLRAAADAQKVWDYAINSSRGDIREVIIEEFIHFDTEITLLTVTQQQGPTLFCPPIGHRQERGDYQESWQPAAIGAHHAEEAREMAGKVTKALTGAGIWGVEFFLTDKGVYFSELSPRPHDTGMVTLAGTQNLSEFELHARAILGLPIPGITLERAGASAVVLADREATEFSITGLGEAMNEPGIDVRLFGKPTTRKFRRMGVALAFGDVSASVTALREQAKRAADKIQILYQQATSNQ